MKYITLAVFSLSTILLGCSAEDSEDKNTKEKEDNIEVTFYQDVAPLYFEKCVQCHQEGGIAPFALDNYKDAKKFAAASAAATGAGTMPPYLVEADGSCGEFEAPRSLSSQEIQLIADWVSGGSAEGIPREDLQVRELPSLSGDVITLSTPDFLPEIVGGDLAEFDEYRCFLVDPEVTEDSFLTGYDVHPGNEKIVHHVLAFPVDMDAVNEDGATNGETIQMLSAESPEREGWPCFGVAGDGVIVDGIPVTWAPGMGAVRFPHKAGVEFPADRKVVIQVHYNLADPQVRGSSDTTQLQLSFASEVQRVAFFDLPDDLLSSLYDDEPEVIPAGKSHHEFSFEVEYDEIIESTGGKLDISGVFPHMHDFGRTLKVELLRENDETCIANVPSWDFGWQLFYHYESPISLSLGDRLRITCGYNTEGVASPILPGWGTQNEMCLAGLMFSIPVEPTP